MTPRSTTAVRVTRRDAIASTVDNAAITVNALAETVAALLPMRAIPASFPFRESDLDAATLTDLLSPVLKARVVGVNRIGGNSGTTDRVQLRIDWDREDPGLPPTIFVKSTPLTAKNRAMVAALSMARNEVKFYRQARPSLSRQSAPVVYAAHATAGARHLLLLEDVGGRGGEPKALCDDIDVAYARAMMTTLADLHAAFWESPRLHSDLAWVHPERKRPGFSLLLAQFRKVRNQLLASTEHELSPPVREMAEFVNAHDWALHAHWETGPQTLIHGDCHLGNTFRLADGSVGLLDFQVVHRAPGLRDVAYFLTHSVPTEVRRAHADELLQIYLDSLAARGVTGPPSLEDAWEALRFFAFDAWDSCAICVVWPGLQAPQNVAASFARASAAVEDFDVMPTLRKYA